MTFCIHDVRISISRLMISCLIKIPKVKKGAYMKKCEGIYSLIGKVNHKSAIYGFELLKEENIHHYGFAFKGKEVLIDGR